MFTRLTLCLVTAKIMMFSVYSYGNPLFLGYFNKKSPLSRFDVAAL